jgi:hypothetical protein
VPPTCASPATDSLVEHGDAHGHPGHQAVLRHLREREQDDPLIRMQLAGTVVFDLFTRMLQEERSAAASGSKS